LSSFCEHPRRSLGEPVLHPLSYEGKAPILQGFALCVGPGGDPGVTDMTAPHIPAGAAGYHLRDEREKVGQRARRWVAGTTTLSPTGAASCAVRSSARSSAARVTSSSLATAFARAAVVTRCASS